MSDWRRRERIVAVIKQVVVLPVLELVDNLAECWPLHWNLIPAFEHQSVGSLWAFVGDEQQLAVADHFDRFGVRAA